MHILFPRNDFLNDINPWTLVSSLEMHMIPEFALGLIVTAIIVIVSI